MNVIKTDKTDLLAFTVEDDKIIIVRFIDLPFEEFDLVFEGLGDYAYGVAFFSSERISKENRASSSVMLLNSTNLPLRLPL